VLVGAPMRRAPAIQHRLTMWFGIRGIGSVYYLAYATSKIELADEAALWATVAFTVVLSTVVHGLTAGVAVERAIGPEKDTSGPKGAA